MLPVRLFIGFDKREAAGFHAFVQSLVTTSSNYALTPLCGDQADGSNAFTYERFRIPERCGWSGTAIYVDGSDMLLRAPIEELARLQDNRYAVQVVQHAPYRTKHERKHVGTDMESANADYPRKNWSSVILWNAGHRAHFRARERMRSNDGKFLHRFGWLQDHEIGDLPIEWNWLADEYGPNENAKLLHWTAGIPGFYHYKDAPHCREWRQAVRDAMRGMD